MATAQEILTHFKSMDGKGQEELLDILQIEFERKATILDNVRSELREVANRHTCVYCGSNGVSKRGKRKGIQQFSCRSCKRWFSENTGTVLQGIHHPEKWQEYLRLMQAGGTIKGIAGKMGISIETSFRWRHKILSALSEKEVSKLGEIVECDEMEFVMNNKGAVIERPPRKRSSDAHKASHKDTTRKIQVVVAVDRNGLKYTRVVEAERINSKHIQKCIGKKLQKGSTLITDRHSAYLKYTKNLKTISHKTISSKEQLISKSKTLNIQRVNQTHKQIRGFLKRFHGGVATKYLQNYLNWYLYQKELRDHSNKIKLWAITIMTADSGLQYYQAIRKNAANIVT